MAPGREALAVALVAMLGLAVAAPRRSARVGVAAATWLACLALAAATAGLALGSVRLAAIDSGALVAASAAEIRVRGFVAAVPRRDRGEVSVRVDTADGRLLAIASEPVADLPVGALVRLRGIARESGDWQRAWLGRLGIRTVLAARELEVLDPAARTGVAGALDAVRARAEAALGRGTSAEAANLLRGFVLGQDDRIDAAIVDNFKASGLAHLLAVSGQNVVLLAVLAAVVLAVLGLGLRARLLAVLGLIAIYVPVAGAGASIQRAGVMGAAGIVAALAGRPRSRWYALLLAAGATLALDPRAGSDVGWQLSFAAVAGILLFSARVAALIASGHAGWRRALADGIALTTAATLATAPLMAHHFGAVSLVALPANLLALPAVAPVMWLGMLAAAAGQLPALPVEPLTWLAGVLAGYVAQVAAWFGAPGWAQSQIALGGGPPLVGAYVALGLGAWLAVRAAERRRSLRIGSRAPRRPGGGRRRLIAAGVCAVLAGLALATALVREPSARPPGLRVTVLDVGQGDAILLQPPRAAPVLVDTGPPDAEAAARLADLGVERLGVLAITHPELDHAGGAPEVLQRIGAERFAFARAGIAQRRLAAAVGARPLALTAGDELRLGALRLDVLWPPAERLAAAGAAGGPSVDPNSLSLVVAARWRGFELLLTGDAEREVAAYPATPVDVLKVAHHGSADAGLEALLDETEPGLALISAGADNPFGHPAPDTLAALARSGTPVMRTDLAGEITIEVREGRWRVLG